MARKQKSNSSDSSPKLPSVRVRTWLSIWVTVHVAAVAISFTSVVEPSALHAQLTRVLHPYLRAPHFGADDRPVYLAHGDASEQPHRLQITSVPGDPQQIPDRQWQNPDVLGGPPRPGLAASDRLHRYLSTITLLAGNEQPSLVAELLLPIAEQHSDATAIRVIRLPTDLNDINTAVETVYIARIVRNEQTTALVQLRERRLSAEAELGAVAEGRNREDSDE